MKILLPEKIIVESEIEIKFQFQGGFAGKDCKLDLKLAKEVKQSFPFFPEDNNFEQIFKVFFADFVFSFFHQVT